MTVPFHEINEGLSELLLKFDGPSLLAEQSVPDMQARIKRHIQRASAAKGRGDKLAHSYWDKQMKLAASKLHKMQNGAKSAAAPAAASAPAAKSASAPAAKKKKAGKGYKGNSFRAIGHEIAKHLHKAAVNAGGKLVGKIPLLSQGKLGKRKIPGLMRKSTAQKLGRKLTHHVLRGTGKALAGAAKLAAKGAKKLAKKAAPHVKKVYAAGREKVREYGVQRSYKKDQKRAAKKVDRYKKSQTKLADKGAADFRVKMQQKVREKHAELQHHKHQAKMREKEHKVELKKKDQDFKKADKAAGEFKKIAQKSSTAAGRMRKEIDRHAAMTKISPALIKHAKDRFHHVRNALGSLFKVTKNKIKQGAFGHQIKGKVKRATDRLRSRYDVKHPKNVHKTEPAGLKHPDIAA